MGVLVCVRVCVCVCTHARSLGGKTYVDRDEDADAVVLLPAIGSLVKLLGFVVANHQRVLGQLLKEALGPRAVNVQVQGADRAGQRQQRENCLHRCCLFLVLKFGLPVVRCPRSRLSSFLWQDGESLQLAEDDSSGGMAKEKAVEESRSPRCRQSCRSLGLVAELSQAATLEKRDSPCGGRITCGATFRDDVDIRA